MAARRKAQPKNSTRTRDGAPIALPDISKMRSIGTQAPRERPSMTGDGGAPGRFATIQHRRQFGRFDQRCPICTHPYIEEIEYGIVMLKSATQINAFLPEGATNISAHTLNNHRTKHLDYDRAAQQSHLIAVAERMGQDIEAVGVVSTPAILEAMKVEYWQKLMMGMVEIKGSDIAAIAKYELEVKKLEMGVGLTDATMAQAVLAVSNVAAEAIKLAGGNPETFHKMLVSDPALRAVLESQKPASATEEDLPTLAELEEAEWVDEVYEPDEDEEIIEAEVIPDAD